MKFSAEDLDFLATMNDIMLHFQIATKLVESNKSTISDAALAYQLLFNASKMDLPRRYADVGLKIKESLIAGVDKDHWSRTSLVDQHLILGPGLLVRTRAGWTS